MARARFLVKKARSSLQVKSGTNPAVFVFGGHHEADIE